MPDSRIDLSELYHRPSIMTPSLDFKIRPRISAATDTAYDIHFGESASPGNLPPCIRDIMAIGGDIVVGESASPDRGIFGEVWMPSDAKYQQ